MNGTAPKQRGAGFWILMIGGGLGACCVLPVVGLVGVGVLGALSETGDSSYAAGEGTSGEGEGSSEADEEEGEEESGEAANEASSEGSSERASSSGASHPSGPDDFLYTSKTSGLNFIAPNSISAEGVNVTLAGEWKDDHRSITLRLREEGRYELRAGGGALQGSSASKYETVASTSAEQGTWTFAGSTLMLTPDGYGTSALAEGHKSAGSQKADPPRQWNVTGVTIDYTPEGSQVSKQRPGLRVTGQSPSWYYPSGDMNWVLRSSW